MPECHPTYRYQRLVADAATSTDDLEAAVLSAVAAHERERERAVICLYAGANLPSPHARQAYSPMLSAYPAMGLPDDKEQPGTGLAADLEVAAARAACRLFDATWAECRLQSCTLANLVVFHAFTKPGDTIVGPTAATGGHLSQVKGGTPDLAGLTVIGLPYDTGIEAIDPEAGAAVIRAQHPTLVLMGRSVILHPDALGPLVAASREVGAVTVYDASHVSGLIAGGAFPNPLACGVDVLTTSTYKTLGGPTGGLIASRDPEHGQRITQILNGALLANADAARLGPLVVSLCELARHGPEYANSILDGANAFKTRLIERGVPVLAPDRRAGSHQVVVRVGDKAATQAMMANLEQHGLLVGRCGLPGRPGTWGLRFGTQWETRRGVTPATFAALADRIADVLNQVPNAGTLLEREVQTACAARRPCSA